MREAIQRQLDEVRERLGIARLYYIDEVPEQAKTRLLFGARPAISDAGREDALKEEIVRCLKAVNGVNDFNGKESPPGGHLDVSAPDIALLYDPYDEVNCLMDFKILPYVAADGGHIAVQEIREQEGVVVLSMLGACSGCPSSAMTLKAGVQRLLTECLPWVKDVRPAEEAKEPDFGFKL